MLYVIIQLQSILALQVSWQPQVLLKSGGIETNPGPKGSAIQDLPSRSGTGL